MTAVLRWPIVATFRLAQVNLSAPSSVFAGFRFPREVITVGVRWYLRYGLSYRDVEELLCERWDHRRSRHRLSVGTAVHG